MTFADFIPNVPTAALFLSAVAIIVSCFTLWFTVLRRGKVCSTRPSIIGLRHDTVAMKAGELKPPQATIFIRTLLFSTGKRGQVVESLFLRVHEGSRQVEFSCWSHGDKDLIRGSGLFVPETGVATNHHFSPTDSEALFPFSPGSISLELVAKLVSSERLVSLWMVTLEVPDGVFRKHVFDEKEIFYSWSPEQRAYAASIENRSG